MIQNRQGRRMLPTYEMHNETALIVFRRAVDRLRGMPSVTARTLAFAVLLLAGDAATAADSPVWFDLYSAYAAAKCRRECGWKLEWRDLR